MAKSKMLKRGRVLLAEPFMEDPSFKRAAVLLCDHDEDGSIGFIFKKPLQSNINELIEELPEFNSEVYYGGPVQTDTIHYLHRLGDLLEDSVEVHRGIYWGGDFEKLKFLIGSGLVQPHQIRFFVGYTGWSEGQLDEEMTRHGWFAAPGDDTILFDTPTEERWASAYRAQGIDPALLVGEAGAA